MFQQRKEYRLKLQQTTKFPLHMPTTLTPSQKTGMSRRDTPNRNLTPPWHTFLYHNQRKRQIQRRHTFQQGTEYKLMRQSRQVTR